MQDKHLTNPLAPKIAFYINILYLYNLKYYIFIKLIYNINIYIYIYGYMSKASYFYQSIKTASRSQTLAEEA